MTPLLDLSAKPRGQWSTEDGLIDRLSRTVNGRIGPDVIVFKSDGSSSLFEYEKPEQKRVFPVFKILPDTEIEGVCLSHSVASLGDAGLSHPIVRRQCLTSIRTILFRLELDPRGSA